MAAAAGFGDVLRAHGLATQNESPLLHLAGSAGILAGENTSLPDAGKDAGAPSSDLRRQLEKLFQRAGEIAVDTAQPLPSRLAAIALLSQADYSLASKTLTVL